MRWWQSISSLFGHRPGGDAQWATDGWQASAHYGRGTQAGATVNAATAGGLPAIYGACRYVSDALAGPQLRIVELADDGGKKPVEDSDAARALAEWSFADRELFIFWAALGGNGFAVVRRNSRRGIERLESIAPRRISAARDEDDTLWFGISPEEPGRGETEVVAADTVAHLRYRNIGNANGCTVFAVPPIVTAAEAIGLVIRARQYAAALWKNGASPVGVLKGPRMLKEPVINRLRQQWNEYYGGENTGKVAILEDGLEWQPIPPNVLGSDAQLVEHQRFGVEEVSRLYGIPPSVLAQTGNASYSTATEEFRAAVLHALRPFAQRVCDCLSRALLTREQRLKGMRVELSLDSLLVAPGKEQSEYLRELLNAGVLSINEARNSIGLPDVAGGDVRRAPVNTTAIENLPKIGVQQPKQEGTQ